MTFREISERYLRALDEFHQEAKRVNEMTAELSYRPLLDNFFGDVCQEFGENIARVFEPRQQAKAGRPDWRFYDKQSLGLFGYIEAKGLSDDRPIPVAEYLQQVEKYLSLGYRVILTDGLEFVFFDPSDRSTTTFSLIDKQRRGQFPTRISTDLPLLESAFRRFFQDIAARFISEQQLVSECAVRARYLADEIEALADLPPGAGLNERENEAITLLKQLRGVVEKHHDPLLRDKTTFSGFVAQTLIFGLIYAHRILGVEELEPTERYASIKEFWLDAGIDGFASALRPFRALTQLLRDEIDSLGGLGIWYEDCCLMLAHVQLREDQIAEPDYHELFERFLEAFDPQTRFDYGAFYTPKELSSYVVALVEEINGRVFDGSIYDEGNRLIDPCCGTGSFLDRLLSASVRSGGGAQLIGFEILPAPYALAHYRMAKISREYQGIHIVLTNTLSDSIESDPPVGCQTNLFADEQQAARQLARPPLVLVVGNPPSSDSFSHSNGPGFDIIQAMLEDFRPPVEDRRSRQNTQKQTQNEFVKFLRWSGNKGVATGNSIVALIVPSTFAENTSYKFARSWFTQHFHDFWILDIDKDARTGVRSSNIFRTLQGRLLFVAVRRADEAAGLPQRAYKYLSIADFGLDEKYAFLDVATDAGESMLDQFETLPLDPENPLFRPRKNFNDDVYKNFWPLLKTGDDENYVFERHCSGIKLAPSSLFVHADRPILQRRTAEIANAAIQPQEILSRWYRGQDKPPREAKFSPEVRTALRNEIAGDPNRSIVSYAYRPFLNVPALISEGVLSTLSRAPGGGTRYRPEIISAYKDPRTFGIALAPAPKDLGESLHRFATFCWYMPDNDLCKRGNAHILCNYFPEYKERRNDWDSTPRLNVTRDFLTALGTQSPDKAIFYVYGILCSNAYLDAFEPALFTTAGDQPPRVPLPPDRELFDEITNLGEALALLEKHVADDDLYIEDQYRPILGKLGRDFRVSSFRIDEEAESITLVGETGELVIRPVPREILEFQIGGYQVLQQWLKVHTHAYTRTALTEAHLKRLLHTLHSLREQIDIINRLDDLVRPLVAPLDQRADRP